MRTGTVTLTAAICVAVAGCGSGGEEVPANGVAVVGDQVITKAAFERRLQASLASQTGTDGKPLKLEPPDFAACIASRKASANAPEGSKGKSAGDLKKECEAQYDEARVAVVEALVQNAWVAKEATARDVSVTEADVKKAFEQQKDQAFKTEAAYQKFLIEQGRTEKEILEGIRLQMLQETLSEKVVAGKLGVTDADARRYYDQNKKKLGEPERRSVRLVLTKDKATADEAKAALEGGESWRAVAKEFSRDKASAGKGGLLPEITETGDKALDTAMKGVATDTLTGPVKTQFGWVVFAVEKVIPASTASFDRLRKQVVETVKQEKRQRELDRFARGFRERYRDQTVCADDFKVASCSNGPESNPTTTTPQMQQPQPAQQEE